MRSLILHAFLPLMFISLAFVLQGQTSAQVDTTTPPPEIEDTRQESTPAEPSFEALDSQEKQRVLDFMMTRGLTEDELLELAYKQLSKNDQEKVLIYADFIVRSRENIPVTEVEYYSDFVEFGELIQGEEKIVPVRFKNIGDEPYIITDVKVSCPCLEIQYTETVVLPGEEGIVHMIAKSGGYEPTAINPNGVIQDNSYPNRRQIIGSTGLIKKKHPNRKQL